jgi:hypothetical protein
MKTVKDLIALLQKEDQDLPILLASDGDGSSFARLSEPYPFGYAQYDLESGETYAWDDEPEYGSPKRVLVIYPAG